MVANRILATAKGLSDVDVAKIDMLHGREYGIKWEMETLPVDSLRFKQLLEEFRLLKTNLQKIWGFEVIEEKWEEYKLPHCTCPKMDNDDWGEHMVISLDCPIHGKDSKLKWQK